MTAATDLRPPAPAEPEESGGEATPPQRRTGGWRVAIPIYIALLLIAVTVAFHLIAEPDLGDPGTLSPTGTDPDGSSQLAAALQAKGIGISTVTRSMDVLTEADSGDATIFIPAPGYLDPAFLSNVDRFGGTHRVVLVEPDHRTQVLWDLPIYGGGRRWATGTVDPDCDAAAIGGASSAAVNRTRYEVDAKVSTFSCYGGGVVGAQLGSLEVVVVGASDPFRNAHFGEVGNAALATALLSSASKVIWVDVHADEPLPPGPTSQQQPGNSTTPAPWHRQDLDRTQSDDPTWRAFPAPLWAALATALVVGFLLALASSRRLGGPVPEPLPVAVPASETVRGRGRLYARIGARDSTLTALRVAAIVRICRLVDPLGGAAAERELTAGPTGTPGPATTAVRAAAPEPATPSPAVQVFVQRVAERTGREPEWVFQTLYGPPPKDDEALTAAVADLDRLSYAMTRDERGTVHKGDTR